MNFTSKIQQSKICLSSEVLARARHAYAHMCIHPLSLYSFKQGIPDSGWMWPPDPPSSVLWNLIYLGSSGNFSHQPSLDKRHRHSGLGEVVTGLVLYSLKPGLPPASISFPRPCQFSISRATMSTHGISRVELIGELKLGEKCK